MHDQPARRLPVRRRVRGRGRAARVGRQARQLRLGGHDARLPRLEVRAPARARQHAMEQVQHAAAGAPGPRVLVWRVACARVSVSLCVPYQDNPKPQSVFSKGE